MDQISHSLSEISDRITSAARSAGRRPETVSLLAVSKTRSSEEVRAAYDAGVSHFGENYLQEALAKIRALADLDITWHFIGAIQSNKTTPIAEHFDWVHTVDREKVARRLSAARPTDAGPLDVLIQVNLDEEPQKAGVSPTALAQLLAAIAPLPRLRLRGLMAIPRPNPPGFCDNSPFARLGALFDEVRDQAGPAWDTLSMGMSGDFEEAISHGATMVRIGTAIFGERRT